MALNWFVIVIVKSSGNKFLIIKVVTEKVSKLKKVKKKINH